MSRNNQICRYFQQGRCHFGDKCKFIHPGALNGSYDARDAINKHSGNYGQTYSSGGQSNNYGNNYNNQAPRGGRQTNYSWTNPNYQKGGNQNQDGGSYRTQNRFDALGSSNPRNYHTKQSGQSQNIRDLSTKEIIEILGEAMDLWEKGNMWLYTCVSLGGDIDCFPGFEDLSPEEMRFKAYEAQSNGTSDAYKQSIAQLTSNIQQKRRQLKDPNTIQKRELADTIEELKRRSSNSQTSSSNNVFGTVNSSNNTNLFGKQSDSVNQSAGLFGKSGSVFGGANSNQTGSVFGGATANQAGSVFGGATANQAGSVFGNAAANQAGSVFGGSNSNQAGSMFGDAKSNPTASVFGGTSSNQAGSVFGGSTSNQTGSVFGAGDTSSTATPGLFGKPATIGQPTTSTPFVSANQNAPFGQLAFGTQSSSPAFSTAPSPIVSQPGIFGSTNVSQQSGVNSTSQPQTGLTSSVTVASSQNQPISGHDTSGINNNSGAGSASVASQGSQNSKTLALYTPLEKLTAEERAAFEAPKFVLGKIPVCPPPREFV